MSNKTIRLSVLLTIFALTISGTLWAADDAIRVVPESELKAWWQSDSTTPQARPQYPIDALRSGVEGCVSVAFEIHSDGSVSNERVWRSVLNVSASKQLEQSALLAVHQWRFIPTATNANRASVYTYQIVTFTLVGSSKWTDHDQQRHDEFEAKCKMTDFPQQVQAMINAGANAKGGTQ